MLRGKYVYKTGNEEKIYAYINVLLIKIIILIPRQNKNKKSHFQKKFFFENEKKFFQKVIKFQKSLIKSHSFFSKSH